MNLTMEQELLESRIEFDNKLFALKLGLITNIPQYEMEINKMEKGNKKDIKNETRVKQEMLLHELNMKKNDYETSINVCKNNISRINKDIQLLECQLMSC